ncbi:MAG: hypothetical protein KA116_05015 [Proteobacteria bacterium]|nr:hypothetical protein [Pseudomonadota bacterium]
MRKIRVMKSKLLSFTTQIKIFSLSLLIVSLANSISSEAASWNLPACKILARKVNTKAWMPFPEKFTKGTDIKALGASKMGKNPAIIFQLAGTPSPSQQGLEFKAQRKCFSGDLPAEQVGSSNSLTLDDSSDFGNIDEAPPASEAPSSTGAKNRSWMIRGLYLTKEDLFYESSTSKLDRVYGTYYGLSIGAAFKRDWGKRQSGLYFGAVYLTGEGESSKTTNIAYKASSSAYGAEFEPYYLFGMGQKFAAGPAVNLMITNGSWKKATNGSIDTTLNMTTTMNLKMEYRMRKYILGSRVGMGIKTQVWGATLDFGAPF